MKRSVLALLLMPALAHAGMDGFYTLASATGKVEVRSYPSGKWRPLKLKGIVAPSAEVRTGNNSQAVLEGGDVADAKRHHYVDEYYSVVTIGPNSLFRTLEPGGKKKIAQGRIAGSVKVKQEHGILQYNDGRSLKPPPGSKN